MNPAIPLLFRKLYTRDEGRFTVKCLISAAAGPCAKASRAPVVCGGERKNQRLVRGRRDGRSRTFPSLDGCGSVSTWDSRFVRQPAAGPC